MSRKYLVHKAVEIGKVQKKLRPSDTDLTHNYLCQPKYDGCNMIAHKFGASSELIGLTSRTGETVHSADHIKEAIAFAPFMPVGTYLGEYWHPHEPQPTISGRFRDTKKQHDDMFFVVFDYLTNEEFDAGHSPLTYTERVARLPSLFFSVAEGRSWVYPAESQGYLVDHEMSPMGAALAFREGGGYDGIILRKPDGTWTAGSGTTGEIIKVKPRVTVDLRVVGFEPGRGKHEGKIGTLLVDYKGKTQGAGTGLKDSEREVSEFEELWLGSIVEIECMGVTEDGYLREPVLKGKRFDKEEPDA